VELKTVGKRGQISLGKSYAGKVIRLERHENGTIVLTAVAVIPESQLWTLVEPHRSAIARGMAWAAETPPRESDPDLLLEQAQNLPRKRARARKT
jgi:hypothetical protein